MTIRPGRNLPVCALALLLLGLVAAWFRPVAWTIPLVILFAVALALRDWLTLRATIAGMEARRRIPSTVARGALFEGVLALRHPLPLAVSGEIRDVFPVAALPAVWRSAFRIPAGETVELRYSAQVPIRGRHTFGPLYVRLVGPFGLLERSRRLDVTDEVRVLPEGVVSNDEIRKQAMDDRRFLGLLTRNRLRGDGLEFESLAEFRPGDDPRRIDWRATARHKRLIARRFQLEQHRDIMILIDCGRLMGSDAGRGTKLDRAVDSALLLGHVALNKGDRCGLAVYDDQVRGFLPPQSGNRAFRILTESVFDVQSQWRESNFGLVFAALQARQRKRALIIVLSDLVDTDTSDRFRAAVASLARRHVVLFAALQTPTLREILEGPTDSVEEAARKAVTLRLLQERERAIASLRRSGVFVLDVEPDRLTIPLVNQYIELRERNLV